MINIYVKSLFSYFFLLLLQFSFQLLDSLFIVHCSLFIISPVLNKDFIHIAKRLLRDEYDAFEAALNGEPPVSIRVNPRKFDGVNSRQQEQIPWCKMGYYLPCRPSFTFDPLFHAGAYYVQEASSMFLEQAVLTILARSGHAQSLENTFEQAWNPVTALDLCAAPGGKSTHLSSILPDGSLLVSNETVRNRSLVLAENTAKWGFADTVITRNDPGAFSRTPRLFDFILADLPCSGEGMFRKDPAVRNEWSLDRVRLCAARQRRIIHDVWQALKPGGYLIYSTCTFNTEENEDNVKSLSGELGADTVSIPVKPEWNIAGSLSHNMPAYRFFPHRTRGEGFFLALMQKHGDPAVPDRRGCVKPDNRGCVRDPQIRQLLSTPEKFVFTDAGAVTAIRKVHENVVATLSRQLNTIAAGLLLGERKGVDFTPSAALSLSVETDVSAFPCIDLSYEQAIAYLQRETPVVPANTPKGYLLVTYRKIPLGFAKNIGNRINNLYPVEWRIKSRKNPPPPTVLLNLQLSNIEHPSCLICN